MSNAFVKFARSTAVTALLTATVAACSSPGEQIASLAGGSQVRSWADWSATPTEQTASLPEAHSWVDTAEIAPGGTVPGDLVSNSGRGN